MSLYQRLAGSQLGSSAVFGSAFLTLGLLDGSFAQAAATGAVAAASWLAILPALKRIVGAAARA
jgi:hypothetical protein